VPIIYLVFALTAQARQQIGPFLPVPYLQMIHKQTNLNAFSDQPAVYRVNVVVNPDGTAGTDGCCDGFTSVYAVLRQPVQRRLFLQKAFLAACVELFKQSAKKSLIFMAIGKIPAVS